MANWSDGQKYYSLIKNTVPGCFAGLSKKFRGLVACLAGWLPGCFKSWLVTWLVGWLAGWLASWLTGSGLLVGRLAG